MTEPGGNEVRVSMNIPPKLMSATRFRNTPPSPSHSISCIRATRLSLRLSESDLFEEPDIETASLPTADLHMPIILPFQTVPVSMHNFHVERNVESCWG